MLRVLVLATTTGYQTRMFGEAAERLAVDLVFATDRCHMIDDPWRDGAIPVRFYDEDGSVAAIVAAAAERPIDGVLAVGDRPTVIAARVAAALGLPWHPAEAAAIARNKLLTRERLRDAGLPVPWFAPFSLEQQPGTEVFGTKAVPNTSVPAAATSVPAAATSVPAAATSVPAAATSVPAFPCVIKPLALSGSRGVIRADDPESLAAAVERLRALMHLPEIRAERNDAHGTALVEGFIAGHEYAVEAVLHDGAMYPLAIFDKPDPLDGPFFEESIYVTPPSCGADVQAAIVGAVTRAAEAIGLLHGPIHAECRVRPAPQPDPTGTLAPEVFVLEVAARPIGGLCAKALRFTDGVPLEELLLRHALGESPSIWRRETAASGVMMIPIPRRGVFRRVDGVEAARGVPHVDDIRITAKTDQVLVPLPEGASYLGFIFARAGDTAAVEHALRLAHACLRFTIDTEFSVRPSV